MYIVIRHINGQIDSNPIFVSSSNIVWFLNKDYLIFDFCDMYIDSIEGCKVQVLKEKRVI